MTLKFSSLRNAGLVLAFGFMSIGLLGPRSASAQDAPAPKDDLARFIYPLAPAPMPTPAFVTDVSDVAGDTMVEQWAQKAKLLGEQWFPLITPLLATDSWKPPKTVRLLFKKELSAPAYTVGDAISVNVPWIKSHPDDFGMIIHELTHVIQGYPGSRNKPGWLVEGIADYIRWWRYEPESPRTRINVQKASYRDAYRTTAAFLAWIVGKYDRRIVRALDESLRKRAYSDAIFQQITGKDVDTLWAEFLAAQPPPAPRPQPPAGS